MNKSSYLTAVAALGAATLLLTGCGGQSLSETDTGGGSVDLSKVEYFEPPAEEKARDEILKVKPQQKIHDMLPESYKQELRWTTSVGYAPMELWDSTNTEIIGVDPALANALSRVLGVRMTITDNDFNAQIPGLLSNRFDVIASSMTDNEKRRETTTFVNYVASGNAFTVGKDNPKEFSEPMDFCGEIISVVDSGSSAALAEQFSADCVTAGKAPYEILPFAGEESADLAVTSGRAAGTITDYPVAAYRESQGEAIRVIPIDVEKSLWGFGVSNENAELAKALEAALQYLIDNGHYEKILEAWNVTDMSVEKATINAGA